MPTAPSLQVGMYSSARQTLPWACSNSRKSWLHRFARHAGWPRPPELVVGNQQVASGGQRTTGMQPAASHKLEISLSQ
jgi:hypothetical protein